MGGRVIGEFLPLVSLRIRPILDVMWRSITLSLPFVVAGCFSDETVSGFVPEDAVLAHLAAGRLKRALKDWCAPFPGYHLYYPSRRQLSPAFTLLAEHLRYRERGRVS